MLILRCTKRFADRLGVPLQTDTNVVEAPLLGDWYANLLPEPGANFALCLNEKTRYAIPLLIDVETDLDDLAGRLLHRFQDALAAQGYSPQIVMRVIGEYRGEVVPAKTQSRSLLGTMNDLADMCLFHLQRQAPHIDLRAVEDLLNQTPHMPMKGANAKNRLHEILQEVS